MVRGRENLARMKARRERERRAAPVPRGRQHNRPRHNNSRRAARHAASATWTSAQQQQARLTARGECHVDVMSGVVTEIVEW